MRAPNHCSKTHQHGTALIVAMVMLLVMTLLALASMRGANLQFLMAGNVQQQTIALVRAENAMQLAQIFAAKEIQSPERSTGDFATTGYYKLDPLTGTYPVDVFSASTWSDSGKYTTGADENERYIIEYLKTTSATGSSSEWTSRVSGSAPGRNFFRITATGLSEKGAQRMVQTIFITRENPL